MDSFRGMLAAPALAALLCAGGGIAVAQPPAPTISPDRPDSTSPDSDVALFFNDYSWRSFIAVNWPAVTGAGRRGEPDRTKAFADVGPRVWTTWKSRYEIFQPGGAEPAPWASYEGKNPCGTGFANDAVTLHSFRPFSDFNQAGFGLNNNVPKVANPLVAQNRTYVRYEVRVNQPEFDSIVGNKWYLASELPTPTPPFKFFNDGSTAVKAAWRILTERDTPFRGRYYVVEKAQVYDVRSKKCTAQDIALVALHIVTKTKDRPQWIWSSFEHVDNVPGRTSEPRPPAGVPFSFHDPNDPPALYPVVAPRPISAENPPDPDPEPMQVIRRQEIAAESMAINKAYWNLPGIKGTVWQNYMLVSTQWPNEPIPPSPSNGGTPLPNQRVVLSNTTMETYFQNDGASCMDCHGYSNAKGRDFVMFVTTDAFSPAAPAAHEPFVNPAAGGESPHAGSPPGADPAVKPLTDFLNAAGKK